jgi:hypothetical protein
MRRSVGYVDVLALALVLSGCGAKPYWVRPSHYVRALGQEDAAIPALDRNNRPTYLRVEAITRVYPTDPQTGLAVAEAKRPGMGWLIAGPILIGVGGGVMATPKEGDGTGEAVIGASIAVAGLALTIVGLLSGGREDDAPSPGFPATVAEP